LQPDGQASHCGFTLEIGNDGSAKPASLQAGEEFEAAKEPLASSSSDIDRAGISFFGHDDDAKGGRT